MYKIYLIYLSAILFFIASLYNYDNVLNYYHKNDLTEVRELDRAGLPNEAIELLNQLPLSFKNSYEYFELLSSIELNSVNLNMAEQATLNLIQLRPSYNAYHRLARIYELQSKITESEKAYKVSINMVPNRFTSRYALYQLYSKIGAFEKAKSCADEMLKLPIKIPSQTIKQILNNVKSN